MRKKSAHIHKTYTSCLAIYIPWRNGWNGYWRRPRGVLCWVWCPDATAAKERRSGPSLLFFSTFLFHLPLVRERMGTKKKCTHQLVEPSIDTARRIRSLSPSVSRSRCKCGLLRYPLYRNRTALYSVSSTARSLPNSYCYRDCDAEVYSLWYPTKNSITHRQGKATQVKARPQLYPLLLSILWYTYDANSNHNCNEHRYLAQTGRRL